MGFADPSSDWPFVMVVVEVEVDGEIGDTRDVDGAVDEDEGGERGCDGQGVRVVGLSREGWRGMYWWIAAIIVVVVA